MARICLIASLNQSINLPKLFVGNFSVVQTIIGEILNVSLVASFNQGGNVTKFLGSFLLQSSVTFIAGFNQSGNVTKFRRCFFLVANGN